MLVALLILLAQLMFYAGFPGIILFFGIHFVLTEMYEHRLREGTVIVVARGFYYAGAYLFFMRFNLGLEGMGGPIFFITTAGFLLLAFKLRKPTLIAAELAFFAPIILALNQPMRFNFVLTYHVILWWMIPMARGYSMVPRKYVLETAFFTLFFVALVFGTYFVHEANFWVWRRELTRFGYVHVAVSFLMSALNPMFLRSGFLRLQGLLRNGI
jgi:hypothetical protein